MRVPWAGIRGDGLTKSVLAIRIGHSSSPASVRRSSQQGACSTAMAGRRRPMQPSLRAGTSCRRALGRGPATRAESRPFGIDPSRLRASLAPACEGWSGAACCSFNVPRRSRRQGLRALPGSVLAACGRRSNLDDCAAPCGCRHGQSRPMHGADHGTRSCLFDRTFFCSSRSRCRGHLSAGGGR